MSCAYDLAVRKSLPKVGSTPDNVAANTYIICSPFIIHRRNVAPFLSTKLRNTSIAGPLYTEALYNASLEHHIKGGTGLLNRAPRFKYSDENWPGPGQYDIKPKGKCKRLDPTPIPGKGKLYACRVPYTVKVCAPTIPTHADENGYNVDAYGDIIKMPPDKREKSDFYTVPAETCSATLRYKGCRWSRSKSLRNTYNISSNPSPADYNVKLPACPIKEEDEEFRQMARLLCYIPRYTEAMMLRNKSEDLPGPGYYDVDTSCFTQKTTYSIKPIPFIRGADRFKTVKSDMPEPGKYNPKFISKKTFSTAKPPFGFEALRFPNKKQQPMPGPGDYEVKSPISEKLRSKINKYSTVNPPFGKSKAREIDFVHPDAPCLPAPDEYDIEPFEQETALGDGCVFKSRMGRFPILKEVNKAGPASYDITEQYNKNHGRTSHNVGSIPFQSSKNRGFMKINNNPGPADYISQEDMRENSFYFNCSPRFKNVEDGTPGPGSYTVHPSYKDALYKAYDTHNLRLRENVCKCKIRKPPGTTYDEWTKVLRGKRKLKWFVNDLADKQHRLMDFSF